MSTTVEYMTASFCQPCKTLLPKVKKFCAENGLNLVVIDIEKSPERVPPTLLSVPTMKVGELVLSGPQATLGALRKAVETWG